jgi:hypothetical protein
MSKMTILAKMTNSIKAKQPDVYRTGIQSSKHAERHIHPRAGNLHRHHILLLHHILHQQFDHIRDEHRGRKGAQNQRGHAYDGHVRLGLLDLVDRRLHDLFHPPQPYHNDHSRRYFVLSHDRSIYHIFHSF